MPFLQQKISFHERRSDRDDRESKNVNNACPAMLFLAGYEMDYKIVYFFFFSIDEGNRLRYNTTCPSREGRVMGA